LGTDDATTVARFYDAFLSDDFETLAAALADEAFWSVGGGTLISGEYRGRAEVVGLFRRIKELSGGTFRPLRSDSRNVLTSPFHVALLDLFLAERDGKALRSHEAWVMELENGKVKAGFHYLESIDNFVEFWS
jgi:hypothetical protein